MKSSKVSGASGRTPKNNETPVPEKLIRKLSALLQETNLAEIEISTESLKVRVRARDTLGSQFHGDIVSSSAPKPVELKAAPVEASASSDLHIIRSPFVGVFYRSPSPTSDAFVDQGQSVSAGQVLCIVEAMKIMNEIEVDSGGVIEKIFVEDGSPVDFNAPLFGIRK